MRSREATATSRKAARSPWGGPLNCCCRTASVSNWMRYTGAPDIPTAPLHCRRLRAARALRPRCDRDGQRGSGSRGNPRSQRALPYLAGVPLHPLVRSGTGAILTRRILWTESEPGGGSGGAHLLGVGRVCRRRNLLAQQLLAQPAWRVNQCHDRRRDRRRD